MNLKVVVLAVLLCSSTVEAKVVEKPLVKIISICDPYSYTRNETWNAIYYWEPDEFGVYRIDHPATIICVCKKGNTCYVLPN